MTRVLEDTTMRLRPSTGTYIWIVSMLGVVYAAYANNLAGMYSALGFGFVVYLQHVIEVKLNRLLDHYGISVYRGRHC